MKMKEAQSLMTVPQKEESQGDHSVDYDYYYIPARFRPSYFPYYGDGKYFKENNPDFESFNISAANWVKRVAERRNQTWAEDNYNYMLSIPNSRIDMAMQIFIDN